MADWEDRAVFALLSALGEDRLKWSVTGPGGKSYRVKEQTERNISGDKKSGTVEFVVVELAADGSVADTFLMAGTMGRDGTEIVTKNGSLLPNPDIDFGLAGGAVLPSNLAPLGLDSLEGRVIVKFGWDDPADADGRPDFRFEGRT